jgi:hypothetical protein
MGDTLSKEEMEEREVLIREQAEIARKKKRDLVVHQKGLKNFVGFFFLFYFFFFAFKQKNLLNRLL